MKKQHLTDVIDVLGAVYETMFENVVEGLQKVEELSTEVLHKLIDESKEEAVKLEKVTEAEAVKLAKWLKEDLNEGVHYLSETKKEFKDWFGFESELLESVALEKLLSVADKTRLQMLALKNELERRSNPHTGEVVGAGTLVCDQCGEKLHFHKAGKVPPCPKCHATSFHRDY